jgi:hypothetical protein
MKHKPWALAFAISALMLPAMNHGAQAGTPRTATPAAKPAGQDELSLYRASLRIDRRDFVKQSMDLSAADGKQFWSLYHQYEAELMKLNDQRVAVVKDYAKSYDKMTEAKADELVKRSLEFREARTALLEKYYGRIAKATSKVVGARFLQVESVLQGAGDVAVGSSLPLMPKQ